MAVSYSSQTKYFTNANDISWSQLRSTLNPTATGPISFSTYKRNTDKTATDPIVPDATENINVSDSTNLKVSGFRNIIKEYVVTQSGTDADLNLANATYWNSNLNKNVKKKLFFTGTSYASSKNTYATQMSSEMYNLNMEVSGSMYGQGGNVGSPSGGSVLYLYNTSSRGASTSYVNVNMTANGRIWSGGGAGSSGNSGNAGPGATCSYTGNFNAANNRANGYDLGSAQPGVTCREARSGATWVTANPNSNRTRCRGGGTRQGAGIYPNGNYQCCPNWTVTCQYSYSNYVYGYAGNGGSGGPGRGYSTFNSSIAGNAGNAGSSGYCPAPASGSSIGNSGNPGNSGGDWGQASSGSAGYSIYGNRYYVFGETSTRIKGPKGYN